MNAEVLRLIDQLERAIDGHPWHGEPAAEPEAGDWPQAKGSDAKAQHHAFHSGQIAVLAKL